MPQDSYTLTELHDSYKAVFNNKDGERVLEHLCKIGHVNESTYVTGDPGESAHREGIRRLVLTILRFVNRDAQEIYQLTQQSQYD